MSLNEIFKKKKFPIFTCVLVLLCIAVAIAEYKIPWLYSYGALWTDKRRAWQYVSFLFTHGNESSGVLFVHLGMNLLGLIPFGILCEKVLGTMRTISIFVVQWCVTVGLFLLIGKDTSIAGISTVVYAYAAIAFACFIKVAKHSKRVIWKNLLTYYFMIEFIGIISTLNPITMSGLGICLHTSGFVVGGIFAIVYHKKIKNSLEVVEGEIR